MHLGYSDKIHSKCSKLSLPLPCLRTQMAEIAEQRRRSTDRHSVEAWGPCWRFSDWPRWTRGQMCLILSIGTSDRAALWLWLQAESIRTNEWFSPSFSMFGSVRLVPCKYESPCDSKPFILLHSLWPPATLPKHTIVPHSTECVKTPSGVHTSVL